MGRAPRESVSWSAHGNLRQECCAVGGGNQATDQAPVTCRPNAAQSVVRGGLRAHTRETTPPSPRGGGRPCRKWSRHSASPSNPCPLGVPAACKVVVRAHCARQGTRGETNKRAAARMLSRTGRIETPLSVAVRPVRAGGHYGDVARVRPTGGSHLLLSLCVPPCLWPLK